MAQTCSMSVHRHKHANPINKCKVHSYEQLEVKNMSSQRGDVELIIMFT